MTPFRAIAVLLLSLLLPASVGRAGARFNATITVVAGTPINLATLTSTVPDASDTRRCTKISIQMAHGGTGRGLVMSGISVGRTPAASASADLTAEIPPATAGSPGGQYYDEDDSPSGGGILLAGIWLDGSVSGDHVVISFELAE